MNHIDLVKYLSKKLLINGQLVSPLSGKDFPVINPATMETIGHGAEAGTEDVDRAVEAAEQAQNEWKHMDASKRGMLVSKCADLLEEHGDELAWLMCYETGKAIRTECLVEAKILANAFRFYGGLGLELKGETIPYSDKMLTMTVREPLGVVGAIIAWNVPLLLMSLKVAPALVAGNTVVMKSAEEAPFTVLRVTELMNSILPAGVFNCISGDGPGTGQALVKHPGIKKVTFTGSVETGKLISASTAHKLIPLTLELGGKSPMIVSDDVDLEKATDGAITSMRFTRQGQSCTAASRMFVHERVFDAYLDLMKKKLNTMKIGDPMDMATDIGAVISQGQFDKVKMYIELGRQDGSIHQMSSLPSDPKFSKGLFIQPTLFTGLSNDHRVCQEEIFGPVTALIPWNDFDEVLNLANDVDYGLAATIWTNDLKKALKGVKTLQAGFVQVNQNLVVQPGLSYGGFKSSGYGKEASTEAMLDHFTQKKTIIFNVGE